MTIPDESKGLVVFAHESGNGRHSTRNQSVAKILNQSGIATLLLDLLTEKEEEIDNITRELRFNIYSLAKRLESTVNFGKENKQTKRYDIWFVWGKYWAAAALITAYSKQDTIKAVVSRGGRVIYFWIIARLKILEHLLFFLIGDRDLLQVLDSNKRLFEKLVNIDKNKEKITVISGASHIFEEPGKLEQVSKLASSWFRNSLIK